MSGAGATSASAGETGLSPVISPMPCRTMFIRQRRRVPATISLPEKAPCFRNAFCVAIEVRLVQVVVCAEEEAASAAGGIGEQMGATVVAKSVRKPPYSIVPYQSTHNTGGTIMGADQSISVVNRYLQVWGVPNVFVMGASLFPQNAGKNPTGPVGALAYWAADAIKNQYLKAPGPLVHA